MQKSETETPEQFVERVFEHFMRKRRYAPHFSSLIGEADSWGFPLWAPGVAGATQRIVGEFGDQRDGEIDEDYVRRIMRALVQEGTGKPYVNHVESLLSDMEGYQEPGIKIISALRRAAEQRRLAVPRR